MVRCKAVAVWLLGFMVAALVSACGGGGGGGGAGSGGSPSAYTVSGTVSGLTGAGLVLQNNGGGNLAVSANGTFAFAATLGNGAAYSVTVLTQPTGPAQTCTVNSGAGTISGANITNVAVVCSTNTHTVSGTVSGLAGAGFVLQNNGGDNLAVSANGAFSFTAPVASGANYNVTVFTQPSGPTQTCTVNSGTGMVVNANISNVTVTCSTNTYTVSGTVSGLAGAGFVLQNNGGDNLSVTANGAFTFVTPVASGATYNVTAFAQPSGPTQTCTVTGGTGLVTSANVSNVTVTCSTNTYTVSGTVSGLAGTGFVLQNNGADFLSVTANGAFTFATPVASGGTYTVTVSAQPSGPAQTCTVTGGTGLVTSANVSNVTVACSTNTYTVSGTVSGLAGTGLVLQNNGANFLSVTANGAFTFTTPVASGGAYTVTVSAQPTALSQTCSVANFTGTVTNANITNVAVTCSTNSYTIGGTVTGLNGAGLVLKNNGGDFLSVAANGAFTFATPVASGGTYNVAVSAQPTMLTQNCTVTSGAGSVAGANITSVAVNCVSPSPRFAFVASPGENSVSSYVVDAATGRLKYIGKVPAGNGPVSVAVDPTGKYAYAANNGGTTISQYTINSNGSLAPMTPATATTGLGPMDVKFDPAGKYAYVANTSSNTVTQYTIGVGGVLTPMAPSSVATGTSPRFLTVDPSGRYVYVTNMTSNDISAYAIGATGALTQISCGAPGTAGCNGAAAPTNFAAGTNPNGISIDPSGKYVFAANVGGTTISQYTIAAGGGLIPMAPAAVAAGNWPANISVDPTGKYAYVLSGNSVLQFTIGAGGGLTPMAASSVAAGVSPAAIAIDAPGAHAYVVNYSSNSVSQYSIGATGALTPIPGADAPTRSMPQSIALLQGSVPVQAVPQYVYVANRADNTIGQYTIGAGGGLAPMAASTVAAGAGPVSVVVDPSGQYAYSANNGGNTVSQYTIGVGGGLVPMAPATVAAGTGPDSIAIDPIGRYAYVANLGSSTVTQYMVGAGGALTPMAVPAVSVSAIIVSISVDTSGKYVYVVGNGGGVLQFTIGSNGGLVPMVPLAIASGGTYAENIIVDPSGQYAYLENFGSGSIAQFTIGASGGLTSMTPATVAAPTSPYAVAAAPSGKYLYVTDTGGLVAGGSVTAYAIGAGGGLAAVAGSTVAAGASTEGIAVDPSGQYAYASNYLSGNISQYTIGAGGGLTPMAASSVAAGTNPATIVTTGTWQ